MWESTPVNAKLRKDTQFFLDWIGNQVLTDQYLNEAAQTLLEAEKKVPDLRAYRTTPQSAPWHCEGPTLANHVERILAGLFAIAGGADVLNAEDVARRKDLYGEFGEMQEIIRENAATLKAYALVHDFGKIATLSFEAPEGSRGAREGFLQHKRRVSSRAQESEKQIYNKLVKSYHAQKPDLNDQELMAKFYDEYEIRIHYYAHAKLGSSQETLSVREAVSDLCRLQRRDRIMLTFLIRNHMDVLNYFGAGPDMKKYELLVARAVKAGLDADDALDLLLAAAFLDSVIGSLKYSDGIFSVDMRPIVGLLYSEQQAAPHRRQQRLDESERRDKKLMKSALERAHLSAEEVFELLNTPFGPERGRVMNQIYALVRGEESKVDFGNQTAQIAPRIKHATHLFDQARLA